MSNVEIREGQIWRDCDKRYEARSMGKRFVRIVRLWNPLNMDGDTFAIVNRCKEDGTVLSKRETRINVKRMKPGATGYELVKP